MTSRFLFCCCILGAATSTLGASEANLANFKPASGADGIVATEGARPWESATPVDLKLLFDYGSNPLSRAAGGAVIENRTGAWLSAEFHLLDPLTVAIQLPFTIHERGFLGTAPGAGPMSADSGMGDIRITPRFGILRQENAGIDVAVQASLELPTSYENLMTTWSEPTGEGLVAFGRRFDVGGAQSLLLLGNVFGFAAPNRTIDGNPMGAGFGGRAGAAWETGQQKLVPSRLFAEAEAKTMPRRAFDDGTTPAEWRGGATWCFMPGVSFELAAGTGLGGSVASPDYRVVTALGYGSNTCGVARERMLAEEAAAKRKAFADQVAAEHAARLAALKAAQEAEAARLAAEQAARERAEAERIAAEQAAAAAAAALDTDGDGVPDLQDNCPKMAGTVENQGCPEAEKQVVVITRNALQILDRVQFRTGKAELSRRSHKLLDQVATVMQNHPEIAKVEVQGHTDDTGPIETNMVLSQARAESVVDYLVRKGVGPERLQAAGYGPARPVAPNETRAGREQNRRVEFKVLGAEAAY